MESLFAKADRVLELAREAPNGRYAELLISDGPLRQSVLALTEGTVLAEHNSPPAGSICVLQGSIRVTGERPSLINEGEIATLTHYRHSVQAVEDAVFLLTTVTSVPGQESHSATPL